MTLTFNGVEVDDPYFNGNQLDYIYTNGVLVWERDTGLELDPPSNLSAWDKLSATEIRLSWTKNASADAITEVWRNNVQIANTQDTTYSDTAVNPNECYDYKVRNTLSGIYTSFSSSATGCTMAANPGKVVNVTASDGAYTDRVVVTWDKAPDATSSTAIYYYVYRDTELR